MKQTLMEILDEIRPDLDFTVEDKLVTDGVLESFDIVTLVSRISEEFEVEIRPKYLVSENFDSVEALLDMLEELLDE